MVGCQQCRISYVIDALNPRPIHKVYKRSWSSDQSGINSPHYFVMKSCSVVYSRRHKEHGTHHSLGYLVQFCPSLIHSHINSHRCLAMKSCLEDTYGEVVNMGPTIVRLSSIVVHHLPDQDQIDGYCCFIMVRCSFFMYSEVATYCYVSSAASGSRHKCH